MSYRTKYHNLIWNNYLNKVFDFIGLTTESSSGCSRIKWVGCDYTKNNKPVPSYFIWSQEGGLQSQPRYPGEVPSP